MGYAKEDENFKENYDQFVQRASRVFQVSSVRSWSRIERAVFNHLIGRLVRHRSYWEISNAMLYACRDEMNEIVKRLENR